LKFAKVDSCPGFDVNYQYPYAACQHSARYWKLSGHQELQPPQQLMTQGGRLPLIMPISVASRTRRGYEEVQYCGNNPTTPHKLTE